MVIRRGLPSLLLAKPSDLSSGLRYALGGLAFCGPPWLLVAGGGWRRVSPQARVLALAALVHVAALVVAGGDWMSLYRLFVPVLPSVILVGAELAEHASRLATGVRLFFAFAASAVLGIWIVPGARAVDAQRRQLIDGARPLLVGAKRVATVDVGWVGVATSAMVIDLAGVTDPSVAHLPGGHTSKRLPDSFLEAREIDALVLLAEAPELGTLDEIHFARNRRTARAAPGERREISRCRQRPIAGDASVVHRGAAHGTLIRHAIGGLEPALGRRQQGFAEGLRVLKTVAGQGSHGSRHYRPPLDRNRAQRGLHTALRIGSIGHEAPGFARAGRRRAPGQTLVQSGAERKHVAASVHLCPSPVRAACNPACRAERPRS